MEPHSDLERRGSINNLIERLTAELGPDGSGDGQYSPFGSIRSPPASWQPAAPSSPDHPPHSLFGGERHKLHFGSGPPPPPAPPYQADPVSAGPSAAMGGELGTAQITDNLAAHLNGFDTPLFDPRQPPPPPPPGSFLSSWLGGWLGCSAPQPGPAGPPPDVSHPPPSPPRLRPPRADHQPHQTAEPPPPPAPPEPSPSEPIPAPAATPPAPPSPASAPAPSAAPAPAAAPSRPSYSAVLAKPAPATGPTPRPAERGARQSAGRAAADPETPGGGGGGGGGGGRRGGRGRRRRVSEAESRSVREEAAAAAAVRPPAAEGQLPRPEPADRETESSAQRKGKTRKLTRTVSAGEVVGGATGRRSETLNNNPDRAQPAVPAGRRPLSYNNNLGPSSTLRPAQTHVHSAPPASAAADGDAAKKVDVNVGKQNCGKTSNETKKVDIALSKPDNKTLSQSRGSQPLNLLTAGSAAKTERVNKDLAFRTRSGGGRGGGRGRRSAEDAGGGGGGPGGELLRRLRGQLWPGVALLAALLSWLLHLVLDVAAMSADLLWTAARSSAEATHGRLVHWLAAGRAALTARLAAARAWLARPSKTPAAGQREGLPENIALPTTGEEAMTRLLACKDSDPYSILGVTHDCSDADIRKYYRRQALLVHPDKSRCPGADEAFKILQRAFQLVGAPEKRAEFDSQAREKHEVNEAFRQYMDEMMTRLREKIEETQNTLRCNNCNRRHRRTKVERPVYAARSCSSCQIRHAAREGDIWAESRWLGLLWRYYACMDGAVFDISEWAACQSQALKHLQANHHTVQYRIISGAKRQHRQPADEPPDRDLEDILNNLCSGSLSGEAQQGRRRGARRRPH